MPRALQYGPHIGARRQFRPVGSDFLVSDGSAARKLVLRLIFVNSAAFGQVARDQREALNQERLGAKERVLRHECLHAGSEWGSETSQGNMRRVAAGLRRQAQPLQARLDLAL